MCGQRRGIYILLIDVSFGGSRAVVVRETEADPCPLNPNNLSNDHSHFLFQNNRTTRSACFIYDDDNRGGAVEGGVKNSSTSRIPARYDDAMRTNAKAKHECNLESAPVVDGCIAGFH